MKFIYRILLIFIIIVFAFLVFFVEECIRLELNLYDKPLVKLKVEEIKSNNKNIYIEEIQAEDQKQVLENLKKCIEK